MEKAYRCVKTGSSYKYVNRAQAACVWKIKRHQCKVSFWHKNQIAMIRSVYRNVLRQTVLDFCEIKHNSTTCPWTFRRNLKFQPKKKQQKKKQVMEMVKFQRKRLKYLKYLYTCFLMFWQSNISQNFNWSTFFRHAMTKSKWEKRYLFWIKERSVKRRRSSFNYTRSLHRNMEHSQLWVMFPTLHFAQNYNGNPDNDYK